MHEQLVANFNSMRAALKPLIAHAVRGLPNESRVTASFHGRDDGSGTKHANTFMSQFMQTR